MLSTELPPILVDLWAPEVALVVVFLVYIMLLVAYLYVSGSKTKLNTVITASTGAILLFTSTMLCM